MTTGSARVLIIGGRGYLGRRTAQAIARVPGATVTVGGRSAASDGAVRVDLRDYRTFDAMKAFDCVVNCAHSPDAAPDQALSFCLEEGVPFVETTTEAAVIQRLYEDHHPSARGTASAGTVVLGTGLLPGLSNLLASAAVRSVEELPGRLEVGVRLRPFSGAGAGMCAVMARMLAVDALRYEGGRLVADSPMQPGPLLPFDGLGQRSRSMRLSLPEATMLHWSTGVPSTAAYVATIPPLPRVFAALASAALAPKGAVRRATASLARAQLTLLRARFLRDRPTPVDLVALLDRDTGSSAAVPTLALSVSDGVLAAGYAIAACVALLLRDGRTARGCRLPDELFTLDEVLSEMRALSRGEFKIQGPTPHLSA